jgi:hypothetical protein
MKYVIYEIRHKLIPTEFYIGSTNNFSSRKSKHKKNTTNKVSKLYWTKLYLFIRSNGGWDNVEMKPIFKGECFGEGLEKNLDIKQKEQYYIDLHKPTLNSIKSFKELKL